MGVVVKVALATVMLVGAHAGALAQGMPESCQKDLMPMMQKRQAAIEHVQKLPPKKTTPAQACAAFKDLSGKNKAILTYMTANKEWCQVPDDGLAGVTQLQTQIEQNRAATCNAAGKQAAMLRQMQRQQQQQRGAGQAGVGSGVKLPQGAL